MRAASSDIQLRLCLSFLLSSLLPVEQRRGCCSILHVASIAFADCSRCLQAEAQRPFDGRWLRLSLPVFLPDCY
jgi:hypothetical protein